MRSILVTLTNSFWSEMTLMSVVAFVVTYVATWLTIRLARKVELLDFPDRDHPAVLHQKPIPRGGGVPLFLGLLVPALFFLPPHPYLNAMLVGSFINVIVGLLDDWQDLSPYLRLLVTLPLAVVPLILAGFSITISNPLGAGILTFKWLVVNLPVGGMLYLPEAILLVLWVVWVCNMVNWTKGASQLPGLAVIAFLTLGSVALKYQAGNPNQLLTARISFVLAASSLAFLPFNFPPEKIFPGFGGSTFIGFNLAALAVLSGGKLAAAILVLGVPVADMLISLFRRLREGRSPLKGDRGHLYHLLLDSGLTKRQVIAVYWLITLLLGVLALQFESGGKFFAIALVFALTAAMFVLVKKLAARARGG